MEVATVMRNNIKKNDHAVVNDSDAPVYEIPHKQAWIYGLANYNEGLDGSEYSNE